MKLARVRFKFPDELRGVELAIACEHLWEGCNEHAGEEYVVDVGRVWGMKCSCAICKTSLGVVKGYKIVKGIGVGVLVAIDLIEIDEGVYDGY